MPLQASPFMRRQAIGQAGKPEQSIRDSSGRESAYLVGLHIALKFCCLLLNRNVVAEKPFRDRLVVIYV